MGKLFHTAPANVPSVIRAIAVAPKLINSLWLMSVGVFYLVAVSYDNIEGILMDALTFEVIFDVEAKYYQWTMGGVHDRLLEDDSEGVAVSDSSEISNKQDTAQDTDFDMFFW